MAVDGQGRARRREGTFLIFSFAISSLLNLDLQHFQADRAGQGVMVRFSAGPFGRHVCARQLFVVLTHVLLDFLLHVLCGARAGRFINCVRT